MTVRLARARSDEEGFQDFFSWGRKRSHHHPTMTAGDPLCPGFSEPGHGASLVMTSLASGGCHAPAAPQRGHRVQSEERFVACESENTGPPGRLIMPAGAFFARRNVVISRGNCDTTRGNLVIPRVFCVRTRGNRDKRVSKSLKRRCELAPESREQGIPLKEPRRGAFGGFRGPRPACRRKIDRMLFRCAQTIHFFVVSGAPRREP